MGKFKQSGGYDKVVKNKKRVSNIPVNNMKVTKESIYPSKRVQFDLNPQGPTLNKTIEMDNDLKPDKSKKIKGIISSVQFKAPKKQENKSTFLKLKDSASKYSEIKQTLLKQINTAQTTSEAEVKSEEANKVAADELNFVARPKARLTNGLLKRILNQNTSEVPATKQPLKPIAKGKAPTLSDFVGTSRKINKKAKSTIKKNLWSQKIDLIKNQIKDKKDQIKREKSVITGDMKPMLDSLNEDTKQAEPAKKPSLDYELFDLLSKKIEPTNKKKKGKINVEVTPENPKLTTKRERREKNLENEKAKAIQKQSIRFKKSQDDISLFNQLLDYKEFTSNPLETLKKHFNA